MRSIRKRLVFVSLIILAIILVSPQKVFATPKPLTDPAPAPETQSTPEPQRHEEHKSTPAPEPEPPKEERDTKVELQNEQDRLSNEWGYLLDVTEDSTSWTTTPSSISPIPTGLTYSGTPGVFNVAPPVPPAPKPPSGNEPAGGMPVGDVDTVVQRTAQAGPDLLPVPIEIVSLNLVSVEPITVTYPAGDAGKGDVKVADSTAGRGAGGQFQAEFPVILTLTFTPLSTAATGEQVLGGLK